VAAAAFTVTVEEPAAGVTVWPSVSEISAKETWMLPFVPTARPDLTESVMVPNVFEFTEPPSGLRYEKVTLLPDTDFLQSAEVAKLT